MGGLALPSTTYNLPIQKSAHLETGSAGRKQKKSLAGLVKLADAAEKLGFHVETLRLRVRHGQLRAVRGPHGTYYIERSALASIPPPVRAARRPITASELEWTWVTLEGLAAEQGAHDYELEVIEVIRKQPELDRALHRLLSVLRYRAAGLGSGQIAGLIGITERQVRRLSRRKLVPALRPMVERLDRRQKAAADRKARALVSALQRRLEAEGVLSHRRRHRPGDWGVPKLGPVRAVRANWVDRAIAGHLRAAGLTDEEIQAIARVGIGADELNELILRGLSGGHPAN